MSVRTITVSEARYQAICDQFGARIRAERERLDKTQAEFAQWLGFSGQSTIARWERGLNLPQGRRIIGLADKLDCSIDWLLCFSRQRGHA